MLRVIPNVKLSTWTENNAISIVIILREFNLELKPTVRSLIFVIYKGLFHYTYLCKIKPIQLCLYNYIWKLDITFDNNNNQCHHSVFGWASVEGVKDLIFAIKALASGSVSKCLLTGSINSLMALATAGFKSPGWRFPAL